MPNNLSLFVRMKVWDIISGTDSGIGCLTYAASVPEEQDNPQLSGNEGGKIQGQDVFDQVYQALREVCGRIIMNSLEFRFTSPIDRSILPALLVCHHAHVLMIHIF